MAEEDLTRQGARPARHGRREADGASADPTLPPSARPGPTRGDLRRLLRARRRRRRAVEGVAVLACLVVLVAYLASGDPDPGREATGGGPPGAGRPSGLPGVEARYPGPGQASPGLRPRQRPPSQSATPTPTAPPVRPTLDATLAEVPAEVDLTGVGSRDWLHWGLRGAGSTVRKRGGTGEIRDEGGRGAVGGWDDNQESFRWRDGTPVESVGGSPHGVYRCGAGSRFTLAVVADGQPRTVRLFAGVWMARGRLDARLSDGGPNRTLRIEDRHTSRSAEFTLAFQAPRGARLVLTWTAEEVFTADCGNVGVQAVALR
ncbi:hypothetical protein GA0070606_2086 [Micromonospora citrea]|uniref:NPCBM/NEW2 domain-containing protein n=1 Tax=Micromonospora citrea TaxID=47855 RepID=A0A1C6UGX6_9ACTN|nr:hypothetical protein [Micromonospora citrea]SCL53221.1 hypothetical protein GA0070606_2086 [Micromonospora citrea]